MNLQLFRCLAHWPLILWALLCVLGFSILAAYAHTPGSQGALGSADAVPGKGTRVLMFLHPKCSCSRASLAELEEAVRLAKGQIDEIHFYVTVPGEGSSESWTEERLVTRLRSWGRGSEVHLDPEGAIAARYGALTSGHVVAYDKAGNLTFSGGITGSRGHRGNNRGRSLLVEVLTSDVETQAQALVFGCGIQS